MIRAPGISDQLPAAQPALGRLPPPDRSRDSEYLLPRLARGEAAELPRRRLWWSPGVWDQRDTSECVAYSTGKWLVGGPVTNRLPWTLNEFYRDCQRNDEWPGEDYDGTSVRAAFRLLKERGLVSEYRWAFDHPTTLKHVLTVGPVVVGTDWHREMFMPDRWGYVAPDGPVEGGHAWCVVGADQDRRHPLTGEVGAYRAVNSWGINWGQQGRFWITFSHMSRLIKAYGEVATAAEVKL